MNVNAFSHKRDEDSSNSMREMRIAISNQGI